MAVIGSSAEARELGAGLRRLRTDRGLTTRELGGRIGVSSANFTHWETGERLLREDHLVNILRELRPDEDERERLIGLHRKASGPGQLIAGTPSIGERLARLIEYEQVANQLTDIAPLMIPGLLQTADYARACFTGLSDLDTRVALRVGRREIITRTRQPAIYRAFIDSEALVRPVAPPDVMADQWRHLIEMQQRPNVDIRIVSSMDRGYNPMLAGPFLLIEFPSADPVVLLEHQSTSAFSWGEEDVRGFQHAVEKINQIAMTPAASAEAIVELVNGMEPKT